MKYDVTIGIPVYQSEAYIRRALESALTQTYPSIEFLIVDDAGNDSSLDIVKEITQNSSRGIDVRIISHDVNLGVSASRNQIIDEAKGTYLYFMDSDDVIIKETISLLMNAIRQYNAEIAFGSYEKIEMSGAKAVYQYPSLQLLGDDQLASFAYRKYAGIQASACNYLVRTSLLRKNNLRFIQSNYWEDFVFTFDLVTYVSRAVLLSDITYSYLCRENSLSHYQQRRQISKDEVMNNVHSIEYLKRSSSVLLNKVYFPNRCFNIMMTDFYMACHILKRRNDIAPSISNREIKAILSCPVSFCQICAFRQSRLRNMALFLLGKLPPSLCVGAIRWIDRYK